MKAFFKYLFLSVITLLLLLVVGSFVLFHTFQQEVQDAVLNAVNEQVDADITLKGTVKLELIRQFPSIAVGLTGLEVRSKSLLDYEELLKAEQVDLVISPLSLLFGNIEVNKIAIRGGDLFLYRDKEGNTNYKIAKKGDPNKRKTTKSGKDIHIELQDIALDDVHFILDDKKSNLLLDLQIDEADLDGALNGKLFEVNMRAKVMSNSILIGDLDVGYQKDVALMGKVIIDGEKNTYRFTLDNFVAQGNDFSVNGLVTDLKGGTDLDINVVSRELDIERFIYLLPYRFKMRLQEFDIAGDLKVGTAIKGVLSSTSAPKVTIDYSFKNATLTHSSIAYPVDKLSFSGQFSNGWAKKFASSSLSFEGFKATIDGKPLIGSVKVFNFINPELDFTADGWVGLGLVNSFLSDTAGIADINGLLELRNVTFKGPVSAFNAIEKPLALSGTFGFQDCSMKIGEESYAITKGTAQVKGEYISTDTLHLDAAGSQLRFAGSITHLRELLLTSSRHWQEPTHPLQIKGTLLAKKIDLNSLLPEKEESSTTEQNTVANEQEGLQLPDWLVSLDLKVDELEYRQFKATQLEGMIGLNNGEIVVRNATCNTMGGKIYLNASTEVVNGQQQLIANGQLDKLAIDQLFLEMENFGQDDLTSDNLKGTATVRFDAKLPMKAGVINEDELILTADLVIKDGELKDYKTLEALSSYIDSDELKHIRFNTLKNRIEIKDRTIIIPEMTIESSAISLALAGTHTFDNMIDYKVQLNVMPVLAGKIRKRKKALDFVTVGADEYNAFLTMRGPMSDPVIDLQIGRFQHQRDELRRAIKGIKGDYDPSRESKEWDTEDSLEMLEWKP